MIELVNTYKARLESIEQLNVYDKTWEWRNDYMGLTGTLHIYIDSQRNINPHFMCFSYDESFINTSYGTLKYNNKRIVLTTSNSKYIFIMV